MLKRGRNRLVILPEESSDAALETPIFIVGCPRSGTSVLRRILDSHSRIACPPESWFLQPLLSVFDDSRSMRGLESMGFDREQVIKRFQSLVRQFFQDYARANSKPRWADKTPFYIDHLDTIDEVFESSPRYVILHRNGLDVAASMTRNIPSWVNNIMPDLTRRENSPPAARAAAYWRDQVEKIEAFRSKHEQRCFVLHYKDLCRQPAVVLEAMCTFLGEPYETSMIDFHKFHHDDGIEDGRVKFTRGIEPASNKHQPWDAQTLKLVIEQAEPMLSNLSQQ